MADITLAELNGRVWLVGGETYLQDLLANSLPREVSIELVPCESATDVHGLWVQHCGEPSTGGMPWQIHPAIAARIRRHAPDHSVFFAQWSAMLDSEALGVIQAAAGWAIENPEAPVVLVEFLDPIGPSSIGDLSRLRIQLVEERLIDAGIARERIGRARRDVAEIDGMAQESQRIDIVVRAAEPEAAAPSDGS